MRQNIIYARTAVNNSEQAQAQVAELEQFAKKQGYNISNTYVDCGVSGSGHNPKSKNLRSIIRSIEADEVARIIVTRIDRISRNFIEYLKFNMLCKEHNTKIISIEDSRFDTVLREDVSKVLKAYVDREAHYGKV